MSILGQVQPIAPLAPVVAGTYADGLVEVRAIGSRRSRLERHTVRTPHFDVTRHGERVRVDHAVAPAALDDDLAGLLAGELFAPGWLRGSELFERIFTGVVLTSAPDPVSAWELFYRNTLTRIDAATATGPGDQAEGSPAPGSGAAGHGTIAEYAPVYAHVGALVGRGSVLELGCCFGFLSLRLAAAGRVCVASDISPGTVAVLREVAPRLGTTLRARVADAARFPAPAGAVDTVLAVHLLEHLDERHGDRVVAEALRLARRRAVIAVPLEDEPDETWGHVRTVTLADLERWGRQSGWRYDVHEHHGGWLVLDRP